VYKNRNQQTPLFLAQSQINDINDINDINNNNNHGIIASKYYQLEEREDSEATTTEIYLEPNGLISIHTHNTDGPEPTSIRGTWKLKNEAELSAVEAEAEAEVEVETAAKDETSFEMSITRTFTADEGNKDLGAFEFDVTRMFTGDYSLSSVGGDIVTISGQIHIKDDILGDMEVGYFTMIDTTAEKEKLS